MTRPQLQQGLLTLLALAMVTNIAILRLQPAQPLLYEQLPPSPTFPLAPALGIGDTEAGGRLLALWLQGFDSQAAGDLRLADLDYERLRHWLLQLDAALPYSDYAIFLASMIYGSVPDPERARTMYELTLELFETRPDHRWYWMAMATSLAWHRLKDRRLALRMADALYRLAPPTAPDWARLLKLYLLRSNNELEAAVFLAKQALSEGRFKDPSEQQVLLDFLHRLESQQERRP